MKTAVPIDAELLQRALDVSGEHTNEALVQRALEEFIANRLGRPPLALFGALDWDPAYDPKAERSRT